MYNQFLFAILYSYIQCELYHPSTGAMSVPAVNHLLDHLGHNNLLDGPDLAVLAVGQARVGSLLRGRDGLAEGRIGAGEGDLGVDVPLLGHRGAAVVVALRAGAVAPHEGAGLVLERAELLARVGVRNGLAPRVVVLEQLVDDLDLLVGRHGARIAVELPKGAEERGAHAPLALGGAAPRVVGPRLERRLHEVAGAVGHAGPQEQHAVLGGRGRAGDDGRDGLDDGRGGWAEGDGAAPAVGGGGAEHGGGDRRLEEP